MVFEERIFSTLVEEILKARQVLNLAGRGLEIKISKHGPDTAFKLTLTAGDEIEGVIKLILNADRLAAKAVVVDPESLPSRVLVETARRLNWAVATWSNGGADFDFTPQAERCVIHAFQGLVDWLGG